MTKEVGSVNSGRRVRRQWVRGVAAAVCIVGLSAVGVSLSSTSSEAVSVSPDQVPAASICQPDPSAVIAALPAGGTFHGNGCYAVPFGIRITKPVTIDGGTYVDPTGTLNPALPSNGIYPVIDVRETNNVTLENLHVIGADTAGGYHGNLAEQDGIRTLSSNDVTISNVTTLNTYGDGLQFWATPQHGPTTGVSVSNVTITQAGRQGVTMGDVFGANLTNVNVVSSQDSSLDAESDLRNIGMGNVIIHNFTGHVINLINFLTGPVTFTDCTMSRLTIGSQASQQPITVRGGSLSIPYGMQGYPAAGITQVGGNVTLNGVAFARKPYAGSYKIPPPPDGPNWQVTQGGRLTLVNTSIPIGPVGTNDTTSVVTVVPAQPK